MLTDWAVGMLSEDAQAPVMQVAPSESTILRAACTAACGFVSLSSCTTLTVWSTPASWIAVLICATARSEAFCPGGPKSDRSPVSGIESPITRSSCASPPPPPPSSSSSSPHAATPSTSTKLAAKASSPFMLRPRIRNLLLRQTGLVGLYQGIYTASAAESNVPPPVQRMFCPAAGDSPCLIPLNRSVSGYDPLTT